MAVWNPWHGCHRYSEGCRFCYIHKADKKRQINTNKIVKTKQFDYPVRRDKNGNYSLKSNQIVYLCFTSDFLIADADAYRKECWQMIKIRSDLKFLFLTKRITRFTDCIPDDWGNGYENVIVGCSIETQAMADLRLPVFNQLPICHKIIILQPMLEAIDLSPYLTDIEEVVVGGEADYHARPLNYDWVLDIRNQCIKANVAFTFRQCGTHFIKDNKFYHLKTKDLGIQARKANINYKKQ